MEKKGQATIIIVVALIILLTMGILIYFYVHEQTKDVTTAEKTVARSQGEQARFVGFIESCIEKQAQKGAAITAAQGGQIFSDNVLEFELATIGYADDKITERTEEDIGKYIDITMDECTHYFDVFKEETWKISEKEFYPLDYELFDGFPLTTDVTIQDDVLLIKTKYPIEVNTGAKKFTVDEFDVRVKSNLGKELQEVKKIVEQGDVVDFDFLSSLDGSVKMYPFDDVIVYSLYYEGEEPPLFLFAR